MDTSPTYLRAVLAQQKIRVLGVENSTGSPPVRFLSVGHAARAASSDRGTNSDELRRLAQPVLHDELISHLVEPGDREGRACRSARG